MKTRRVTFNINGFLQDLTAVLDDRPDLVDDVVQRYKDFLGRTSEPIRTSTKQYIDGHILVVGNEDIKSYLDACHRANFEK